ncbi:MAG: hypothetical protein ACTHKZ_02500 [Lysobacteraceae bacterium]
MHLRLASRLALLPCLLMLGACATSRSTLSLQLPEQGTYVTGDKIAQIEAVTDARHFEADPDDPGTPSLKGGDKYALDAAGREKAIARKRNTYGMAIGDILLDGSDTVPSLTRELVAQGLRERGYRVLAPGESAPDGTLPVRVKVDEFWAWFTPGFWAATIEARVRTDIEFPGGRSAEVIGHGENTVQSGRDRNWQEAYERAFADYREKLRAALQATGL